MRAALLLLLPLLLLACEAAPDEPEVAVISTLEILRELSEGRSNGWNLDGVVSDENDPAGCFLTDLVHSDGTPGIDNSFGGLLPALEAAGGAAISALIQASVDSGELLILLEVIENDDGCVDLNVLRGIGEPAIGGHGKILPGQTYDRDPTKPGFFGECVQDDSRVVRTDGFEMGLPLNIFDEHIDLTMLDGRFEMHRRDDGTYDGIFAGGVSTAEIRANMALLDGIGEEIPVLMETAMDARADLEPDFNGFCSRISVGFTFEAVSAYLFD
jgi:hypothetical protein